MTKQEYFQRRYREEHRPAYEALIALYPFGLEDLPGEEWKPIPGYNAYHVSNFGRVKSFHKGKSMILKPSLHTGGYLIVGLHKDGKAKPSRVNRLVAELFIPNPLGKPEVNHLHGRFNNYAGSLEWSTRIENERHAVETGLVPSGADNCQAKLNDDDILYIRENPNGLTIYELGEMFGVDPQTISNVQRGLTYKNVGGVIRKTLKERIPDAIRTAIRAEYKRGVVGCGCRALSRKYNIGETTVWHIIHTES